MEQSTLAILFIGASMFIPLWIGAKAGERDKNTIEDFFIHSRNMGVFALFITVQATWWSAFAFLGSTAYYYSNGPVYWTTIGWDVLFGLLFYEIGKRIWFYGKKNQYITATDFFTDIYHSKILGIIVTFVMMLFTIPYFQIQISGGAYLIEAASRGYIPSEMGAFLFTTVIVIYVWTGGLRAVAWADVFYELLIIVGALLGGFFIIYYYNGIENLFLQINEYYPAALTLRGPQGTAGPLLWISMFIIVPIGALMGPPLWIRMYAVRDVKTFYIMPLLLSAISFINIAPMLIGNAGILLKSQLVDPDTLFPRIFMDHAPYMLAYIILIGGAAAAMSTANSQIHSISAIYTMDIHKQYINKNLNDKKLLNVSKIAIVIFAILSYLTYIFNPGILIQLGLTALSGTAQVFVPVVGALFWDKSNSKGAIAGILSGLIALVIFSFINNLNIGIAGFLGFLTNIIVFVTVSSVTPKDYVTSSKIKELRLKYKNTFS